MNDTRYSNGNFPFVSIILLNYNGYKDTIECIQSLLSLEYRQFNIIVVDNASPDHSLSYIQNWLEENPLFGKGNATPSYNNLHSYTQLFHSKQEIQTTEPLRKHFLTTLQAGSNLGFAAGNNIGIKHALHHYSPDFVWLLNNDTVVAPDSLSHLVSKATTDLESGIKIGLWGSKLLYFHQRDTIQAVGGKLNLTTFTTSHLAEGEKDRPELDLEALRQDYVVGASLFVSRKFIEEVGPLSEEYFLYFEELDWATRAKRQGYALGYVSASKVFHKEGRSIGSSSSGRTKSELADYHGIRSKIIYFRKFYPQKALQLYALLMASAFLRLSRFQVKRALQVIRLMASTK